MSSRPRTSVCPGIQLTAERPATRASARLPFSVRCSGSTPIFLYASMRTCLSHRRLAAWVACASIFAACAGEGPVDDGAYANVVDFDTAYVRLVGSSDTVRLTVELAVSDVQKKMGLMERRRLSDSAGMLFIYDSIQPEDAGFWMYRTRLPLDIAFLDSAGVIRAIRTMVPCETTIPEACPIYTPGAPYRYALEVNQGFFARSKLKVGDSVTVQDAVSATTAESARPSGDK